MKPIAYIENDFKEKFGIPRQSGRARTVSKVIFYPEFRTPEALRGLEEFSHIWLIFDFSKAHRDGFSPTVRPPRLGGNIKKGVFATRSPFRPNSIGLSAVKLLKIERTKTQGDVLVLEGADLLDGTPIFDVKPYLPHSDCILEASGSFSDDAANYALNVDFPYDFLQKIPPEKRDGLIDCLKDDPRPSYQDDGREYGMQFDRFNVRFRVLGDTLTVLGVDEI
jgi:tRNA-Thr(GGU) m(6)t(6)A37 methyltransferase TsaA